MLDRVLLTTRAKSTKHTQIPTHNTRTSTHQLPWIVILSFIFYLLFGLDATRLFRYLLMQTLFTFAINMTSNLKAWWWHQYHKYSRVEEMCIHLWYWYSMWQARIQNKRRRQGQVNGKRTGGNKVGLTARMGIKTRAIVVNMGSTEQGEIGGR